MIRRSSFLFCLSALGSGSVSAGTIVRTLDPCLSPDGKTMAFSWQGDIWTVASAGGMARRLTVHPADDTSPKWSPDGSRIFFASTRAGSLDVFSIKADGDDVRRITFESASEYPCSVSPDGQSVYGYTTAFGRMDLFCVKSSGGDIVRLTGGPLEVEYYPTPSPDGKWVVYNTSGGPGNWRKPGHAGSNTGKVWIAEAGVPLKNHRMVFPGDRDDLFPVFLDRDNLAFVSTRNNGPNVWTGKVAGGGLRQLTHFSDGTVRALSVSNDGSLLAFQKDSRIWTLDPKTGVTAPIDIEAPADSPRDINQELNLTTGANEWTVSPNGKRAVVSLRGDLFLIPEKGGTTRRLTTSPRFDGEPVWLDDKTVLYVAAGERSLRSLKTVSFEGDVKDFVTDSQDLNCPMVSPDRKWVAFHRGNREIVVVPAGGGSSVKVAEGSFAESIGGNRSFNWSPDSQWLVYSTALQRGVQVAMVKYDGSIRTEIVKIGKSCSVPSFSSDGKAVFFGATEGVNYSEVRSSKNPMYVVDLVPQPVSFSEDDLDKIDAPKEDPPKDVTVKIVARGLNERKRALTTGDVGRALAGADARTAYANVDAQFSSIDLRTGTVRPIAGVVGAVSAMEMAANKQKLYYVQAGRLFAMSLATQAVSPVTFSAQYTVNLAAEESALFDEVWWAMDRLYYNPAMNGKDWTGIRTKFATIVPGVQSREDFYALMGEMLELLDSSHLGANAPSGTRTTSGDDTALLGVEWDWRALDARGAYVVAKVYEGTPAALPDSELLAGDRVTAVDGQSPSDSQPMASLLNKKTGKKVRLSIVRGERKMDVDIQPSRSAGKTGMVYSDWVETNRAMVDKLSNGRLGYIHIQSMDVPSLDVFLRDIQTELNGKDGVLLDVRYNGGGFTSHIILNTMLKFPWLIRTNRDSPEYKFSENSYRGNALELPAACLTNQYSFSNAEIFSEGFRMMKFGPIIGEPTAGGVIGTSAYGLWDGGSIRMPASGAYAVNGENLEAKGRLPDIDVRWDPNTAMEGRDPQLEAAVKALLGKIKK